MEQTEIDPDEMRYRGRLKSCVEAWPAAAGGEYDPRCCRFPKSCSADVWRPEIPESEVVR